MATDRNAAELDELRDLLVKRATERLSAGESARLAELRSDYPGQTDDVFDRTAAAIFLAAAPAQETLPAALRDKLAVLARAELRRPQDRAPGTED